MDENKRLSFEQFIKREVCRNRIWSILLSIVIAIIFSILILLLVHQNMKTTVLSIKNATEDIVNSYTTRLVEVYYKPNFMRILKNVEKDGPDILNPDKFRYKKLTNPYTGDTPTITSVYMIFPSMDIKLVGIAKTASGIYQIEYFAGQRKPVYQTTLSIIRSYLKYSPFIKGINIYTSDLQPVITTASISTDTLLSLKPDATAEHYMHKNLTTSYIISPFTITSASNGNLYIVFYIHSYTIVMLIIAFSISLIVVATISILTAVHSSKKIAHKLAMPLEELHAIVENLDLSRKADIEKLSQSLENAPKEIYDLALKIKDIVKKNQDFLMQIETARKNITKAYEHASKREQELYDAYYTFATTLARIAEKHDDTTGKHIQRVGQMAGFLAEKMGLPPMLVDQIGKFAPLHDIGKIMVPDRILQKKGPLTEEEWEIMKKHTLFGAELIGDKQHFMVARNIALYHHEKYDGSGYPFGLKGNQIPIEAQIVSLIDVYDALRDERPYKPALTHEEAMKIILEGDRRTKPEHFNAHILEVFKQYHEQIRDIYDSLK